MDLNRLRLSEENIIYVALGANLGDRQKTIRKAIARMAENFSGVRVASLYETEPWGITDQPDFLNTVVEARARQTPWEVLQELLSIETQLGRTETYTWGPRMIDLDLLLYGQLVLDMPYLKLPHPGISERDFVLQPLIELQPDLEHPVTHKALHAYLTESGDSQQTILRRIPWL